MQPVIGYLSDNTWHPTWGRRRPFFFLGAVLAAIALFLMPNSVGIWMAVAVSGLVPGYATKHLFGNHAVFTLGLGGVSMLIAAVLALFVTDRPERAAH